MEKNYRLQLKTKDGVLVMNRGTNISHWQEPTYGYRGAKPRWIPDKMIRLLIEPDCREKGVRLLSYTMHDTHLEGIVEWLSNK